MPIGKLELAYAGGLFDAEGSIRDRSKDPSRRGLRSLRTWTLKSRQARCFLSKIQKYLVIKAAS